jgi:type IV secretory pathway TrbL component
MRNRILHPFLFAVYPVLALLAYNIEEIKVQDALRAFVISLLVVGAFNFLLSRWLKNPAQAALIVSFSLLLFYTYGQVYNLLKPLAVMGTALGRHRLLLPVWILVGAVGLVLILRR